MSWIYTAGMSGILNQTVDVTGADTTLTLALLQSLHSPDQTDDFLNDVDTDEISVTGYSRKVNGTNFGMNDTTNNGVSPKRVQIEIDTDVTFASLATGQTIGSAVMFQDSGTPSTSRLLFLWSLTATPTNGGDITLDFDQTNGNVHFECPVT